MRLYKARLTYLVTSPLCKRYIIANKALIDFYVKFHWYFTSKIDKFSPFFHNTMHYQ